MAKKKTLGTFYGGISGLVLPFPKYKFPEPFQQSSRLTYYASIFNSIEINRSFYVLPIGKTMAKWAGEVPDDFRFTFKLWQEITHNKGLQFKDEDVKNFMAAIDNVGDKKGCLLIQFPASIKNSSLPQLENILHAVQTYNANQAWRVAVEFRDASWYNKTLYKLLDAYKSTIVIHDKSRGFSPQAPLKSTTTYLRFHGPKGDYRGSYDEGFLEEYGGYVREWLAEKKDVFVYFNNTMGEAFDNLQTLKRCVNPR